MADQCGGSPKKRRYVESMRGLHILNKAYLKDNFPLSQIDQIIDASARHGMLSFLDAFSGYHQIPMHPPNVCRGGEGGEACFIWVRGLSYGP